MFLINQFLQAQTIKSSDSIETARQLAYSKNYNSAIVLLKAFELNHPNEINSVRLHAQILYWMQDYDQALQLCEKTLKSNPNQYLQLDYARMLFELNKLKRAQEILNDYYKSDRTNVEVNNMLGTIAYWKANPRLAKFYFTNVLEKYPHNEWALKYMNEIKPNTSPFIKIKSGLTDDTQPLQSRSMALETGWYTSSWLNPTFNFQWQGFKDSLQSRNFYSFLFTNKFILSKIKTGLLLAAGVHKSQSDKKINLIGGLEIITMLSKNLGLRAAVNRGPYLYTISSLENTTFQNTYTASLNYFKDGAWSGMAFYNVQQFVDNNHVNTAGGWVLTPPLKFSKFALKIGYGFNFSNSKENRFTATTSIPEIIANNNIVDGIYNPYYTPQNQKAHSAIGNLTFTPTKSFSISLNGSLGVYATADNPYLFIDKDANNEIIINRGFTSTKFKPLEITARINYSISNKIILDAGYSYNKTLFYTSNNINLALKYIFIK